MKLLKNTILAGILAALLPVGLYAQMDDEIYIQDPSLIQDNQEEEDDGFLSWGSYMLNLEHESQETTEYTDLYHAFTDSFIKTYGVDPQRGSIDQFRDFYAKHRKDYGAELLLPTMAIWNNRPMLSIVPLPDRLEAYWGDPQTAGDTYDFMSRINHEDTIYFMGKYMGSFYGHPKRGEELKKFWNVWAKRKNSFAQQDIVKLKRKMLSSILEHDNQYAVMELAAGEKNALWPQLYLQPLPQEQERVQEIISSVCMDENPTKDCAWFVYYAEHYKYVVNKEVQKRIEQKFHVDIVLVDPIYSDFWLYNRTWAPSWRLVFYYDWFYPYYYLADVIYDPFLGYFIYPNYWHFRPNHPIWHNHHIYIGDRPQHGHYPGYRPPHHRPNFHGNHPHVGNPGARPPRPHIGGNNRPNHGTIGNHGRPGANGGQPGSTGRRPGHGNGGHNNGGNGGQPGHGNGGSGNHGNHPGNGGHGNHSGNDNGGHNNGDNGGHGNGGNGGQPGHGNGGNGGQPGHGNGGNGGQPGHGNGNNGTNMGGNGTQRPHFQNTDPKVDKQPAIDKQGSLNRVDHGGTKADRPSGGSSVTSGNRSSHSSFGGSYPSSTTPTNNGSVTKTTPANNSGATKRPVGTTNHGNIDRTISRPSFNGSVSGSSRSSGGYTTPSRPSSGGSVSGSSRSSGGYTAPSRPSSSGSIGGSSRSSGGSSRPSFGGSSSGGSRSSGGFSGGSHGGSSSGSHGGSHGGSSGGSHGGSHGGRR